MADFLTAYNKTVIGREGGLNPGIGENFTYRGIDEGENPHWPGWPTVHAVYNANKAAGVAHVNALLAADAALQANIQSFYKANYWDTVKLDLVNDQKLANNLFDCSVNQGEGLACKFMQIACNYVAAMVKATIKPLVIDLKIGPGTLAAFNSLSAPRLMLEINAEREASYRNDRQYAQWGKIWEERLENYVS